MYSIGDFYMANVCHTCKNPYGNATRRCTRCKTVSYCSKEHQHADWKRHRHICKIISEEHKHLNYNITNQKELQEYIQQRGILWQLKLGRKLLRSEYQMLMFPRICALCFKQDTVFDCFTCHSEYYCSEEHQEQHKETHKKFCRDLKLSLDMECYLYHHLEDSSAFSIKKVEEEITSMPNDFIKCVLKSLVPATDLNYLHSCDEVFSGITILYALEQTEVLFKRRLLKVDSLEIHMIGATEFEFSLNWTLIIEIFFHWIKNLKEIHIVFVGPEVTNSKLNFQSLKTHFCDDCRDRDNLLIKEANVYRSLYHDVVDTLEKPDVIVAFNSGLHEFHQSDKDSWKNSLRSLVAVPKVPLVLTAYTYNEIKDDLKIIEGAATVRVVYGPKKNPFANQRPFRDWTPENDPVYFINNFLAVVFSGITS